MSQTTKKGEKIARTSAYVANPAIVDVDATKIHFLLARGWRHKLVENPWQWEKPPLPARYRLEDAYDLERSREKL